MNYFAHYLLCMYLFCFCDSSVFFAVLMLIVHCSFRFFFITFLLRPVWSQKFFTRPRSFFLFRLICHPPTELSNLLRTALVSCLPKRWQTVSLQEGARQAWFAFSAWLMQSIVLVRIHVWQVCRYKHISVYGQYMPSFPTTQRHYRQSQSHPCRSR